MLNPYKKLSVIKPFLENNKKMFYENSKMYFYFSVRQFREEEETKEKILQSYLGIFILILSVITLPSDQDQNRTCWDSLIVWPKIRIELYEVHS